MGISFARLMRIYGHSMVPVLHPGQLVMVSKGAYESRAPKRGEIAAARPASLEGKAVVKRIVGLPRERVHAGGKEWHLDEGQYFLLGDQPESSFDSRIFGPVTRKELIGPVRLRLWPWKVLAAQDK